jgi:hypothetical protein
VVIVRAGVVPVPSRQSEIKQVYPRDTMPHGKAGGTPAGITNNSLIKGNIVYIKVLKKANVVNSYIVDG